MTEIIDETKPINTLRLSKSFKAKARAKQNPAIRFADWITRQAGSAWFLIFNTIFFAVWLILNVNIIPGIEAFDPFPFGLLTTIVSLEAIGLSIVILISQNVASRIADLREEIDLEINTISEKEITKIMELLLLIAEKNGVDVKDDLQLQKMLQPLNISRMEKKFEKEI